MEGKSKGLAQGPRVPSGARQSSSAVYQDTALPTVINCQMGRVSTSSCQLARPTQSTTEEDRHLDRKSVAGTYGKGFTRSDTQPVTLE